MTRKRLRARTAAVTRLSNAGPPSLPSPRRRALERNGTEARMHFDRFSFGALEIDGSTYEQDVVIDCGEIRKRKKAPSKRFREEFGHTPLSLEEKIPWKCRRLVIGTGAYGALPVMKEVKREADRRGVELLTLPTHEAIGLLSQSPKKTNAILHVT